MPRIFSPNEGMNTTQGYVDFYNGAAAVGASETAAIAFFTAAGCDIDTSKHALTELDKLPRATLDAIATYLGITEGDGDGKYEVIRDIEGVISTALLTELTVASTAGTEVGDTNVAVTGEGEGQLVYSISAEALTPLYRDYAGDWTAFDDEDDITAATDTIVNVAEIDANGYIVAFGYDTVVAKAAG
jgi:hypothetical protein